MPKGLIKKSIMYVVGGLVGFLLIILVNIKPLSELIPGVRLPFGWQGPYMWIMGKDDYKDQGVPFKFYEANKDFYSYWNNQALCLNAMAGIGIGMGTVHVIRRNRPKHKTKK